MPFEVDEEHVLTEHFLGWTTLDLGAVDAPVGEGCQDSRKRAGLVFGKRKGDRSPVLAGRRRELVPDDNEACDIVGGVLDRSRDDLSAVQLGCACSGYRPRAPFLRYNGGNGLSGRQGGL